MCGLLEFYEQENEMKTFRVAVFVSPGKRGWIFSAYTTWRTEDWAEANMVYVRAATGTEAKRLAIAKMKGRFGDDLNSRIPPSGVNVARLTPSPPGSVEHVWGGAMKEKPIIFSGSMVRAILGGRKTMTRRVIKPQPNHCQLLRGGRLEISPDGGFDHDLEYQPCPYPVGARLWVRETWQICHESVDFESGYVDNVTIKPGPIPKSRPEKYWKVFYAADGDEMGLSPEDRWVHHFRPSIFMPKWATRLWLTVTKVRVERVQDISEEDARSEGIVDGGCLTCGESEPCGCDNPRPDARDAFIWLWDSINGKRPGCAWADNPWVWIYDFERSKP